MLIRPPLSRLYTVQAICCRLPSVKLVLYASNVSDWVKFKTTAQSTPPWSNHFSIAQGPDTLDKPKRRARDGERTQSGEWTASALRFTTTDQEQIHYMLPICLCSQFGEVEKVNWESFGGGTPSGDHLTPQREFLQFPEGFWEHAGFPSQMAA